MNIHVEVSEFYDNPENVIKRSDFVISRAGALSLSEIISLGRGVLMIPLSNAIDNHQVENAKNIQDINLGIMHEEKDGLESLIKIANASSFDQIIDNNKAILGFLNQENVEGQEELNEQKILRRCNQRFSF